MTIKTYRTRELKGLSLHLFIENDVRTQIVFKRGCTLGSTATYTTSNPKIQKAMESLKSFGTTFYLESEVPIVDESSKKENYDAKIQEAQPVQQEEEVVDILDARTFKNLVELRNALIEKGVDASMVTNVKAAENLARKNGYNYTVEKLA